MKDDTWWYGTYYLDNPNASVGGNYVGPSPKPNCGNWCIQVGNRAHRSAYLIMYDGALVGSTVPLSIGACSRLLVLWRQLHSLHILTCAPC